MKQKIRLKAQLMGAMCDDYSKKKIIRTSDFAEGSSLQSAAEHIIESFGFECDHAFGIYDNIENPTEGYSIFADMPDGDDPMGGKSIKNAKVGRVFNEKNKVMVMIFDFGDEWIFKISCVDIMPIEDKERYPMIISKQGTAPDQYPDYEDEEDE